MYNGVEYDFEDIVRRLFSTDCFTKNTFSLLPTHDTPQSNIIQVQDIRSVSH